MKIVSTDEGYTANEHVAEDVLEAVIHGRFRVLGNEGSLLLIGIESDNYNDAQLSFPV